MSTSAPFELTNMARAASTSALLKLGAILPTAASCSIGSANGPCAIANSEAYLATAGIAVFRCQLGNSSTNGFAAAARLTSVIGMPAANSDSVAGAYTGFQ